MTIYTWHKETWRQLMSAQSHLPHALLLQGKSGIGKADFAREMARALLCESPLSSGVACGECPACAWYSTGSHPDFRLLSPTEGSDSATESPEAERSTEKKGSAFITVAQVRELTDFINLSTHRNGRRVILIHPAEAMNMQAANALLKTLEEPPPQTLFILVSHQPQRLLPTIRSRCRQVALPTPPPALSIQWLQEQGIEDAPSCLAQSGNAPLEAQLLSSPEYQAQRRHFLTQLSDPGKLDPLTLAEQAEKLNLAWVVNWLQKWVYDLIRARLAGGIRYQADFSTCINALSAKVNLIHLLSYQRELLSVYRSLQHPLNTRLVLEQILVAYWQLVTSQERIHV